jgi:1-acyl-sn-glycerol-3-phosphate acyltransferase
MAHVTTTDRVAGAADAAEPLIEIARATLQDLRREEADSLTLTLDSTLDHDLGLDSLARVELFTRIEHELRVRLPDSLFETAETLRDIAVTLGRAPGLDTIAHRDRVGLTTAKPAIAAPPASVTTLDQVLRWHREQHPEFAHITVCVEGREEIITYDQLWRDAREIAGGLQQQGLCLGDTVALMLPTGRDYFGAFFGILLAGAVPVPLYPPTRLSQIEEHVRRHAGILANAMAGTLITTTEMRRLAGVLRLRAPSLHRITTAGELRSLHAEPRRADLHTGSTALLQYTSGSTGQPKGVVLTHANVLSNIEALGTALDVRPEDVFVSWLPLYHDMGLIGAWLGTLFFGLPLVVMSPLSFLNRPLRWLEAIHRHRATLSAAPNFAYELCLKRITEDELTGLDLSTWRIAMNGAEAVIPDTLQRFQERFARCGLRRSALTPVYGLAECSVGLTIPPLERGPLVDVIERESFVQQGTATPASASVPGNLSFVSCGRPLPGHEVRIVDNEGQPLGERRAGRLEFRGPSATQGYHRNPEATSKLLRDGWLDSGDRAYVARGEVYVTGRIKDIVIRAGRHIYPDELEAAIGAIPGVRKGCVAVFGSKDVSTGTERVIVLAETRVEEAHERQALHEAILTAVVQLIGEPPDDVALVAPHTVLKTSSGKIRRAASREVYESGRHESRQRRAAWLQLLHLTLSAAGPASRHALRRLSDLLYGMYFWMVFAFLGSLMSLLYMLPLSATATWSIGHRMARLFLALVGIHSSVQCDGPAAHSAGGIVVANHASYLDGLLLMAALPRACRFVAKRELARVPVVGWLLRRLRVVFVERFAVRAGVEDARRLARLAAQGESCIFFPEGTFVRAPGVLPFHLGAFAAAVAADRPIIPIALRGARTLLRDGQWLPQRGPILVHIGAPIRAAGARNAFEATIQLRDAARRHILAYCGEPDLVGMPARRRNVTRENIERRQLDPASAFASPSALLECATLADEQKIDLLHRWYYDAVEVAVAEEEGMPARDSDLVREILQSLEQLEPIDVEHTGPSKQHGLAADRQRNTSP